MIDTYTIERIYHPALDQSNAINAAADKDCKAADMAGFYADCIRADTMAKQRGHAGVNWKLVNEAIVRRWPKGLSRIKNAAWKQLEPRKEP